MGSGPANPGHLQVGRVRHVPADKPGRARQQDVMPKFHPYPYHPTIHKVATF